MAQGDDRVEVLELRVHRAGPALRLAGPVAVPQARTRSAGRRSSSSGGAEYRSPDRAVESIVIGAWVALWQASSQIFLYDWWPIRAEARLCRSLAASTVEGPRPDARLGRRRMEVLVREASTTGDSLRCSSPGCSPPCRWPRPSPSACGVGRLIYGWLGRAARSAASSAASARRDELGARRLRVGVASCGSRSCCSGCWSSRRSSAGSPPRSRPGRRIPVVRNVYETISRS